MLRATKLKFKDKIEHLSLNQIQQKIASQQLSISSYLRICSFNAALNVTSVTENCPHKDHTQPRSQGLFPFLEFLMGGTTLKRNGVGREALGTRLRERQIGSSTSTKIARFIIFKNSSICLICIDAFVLRI